MKVSPYSSFSIQILIFIFHLSNVLPAGEFDATSFVLFKGKDKLNFLSAVIVECSAGFSYSNDASFSSQPKR